jgi:4-diphosphocytidyl-2C-methyl-D-erythritol kinase
MFMSGRGDQLRSLEHPLPASYTYSVALAWPDISVPTEGAYSLLTSEDYTDGSASERLWAALEEGQAPDPQYLTNCFERTVFQQWPGVARLHERMTELAGVPARLSGSGSSIFAITDDAAQVVAALRAEGYEAQVVHPVPQGHLLSCSASLWEGHA